MWLPSLLHCSSEDWTVSPSGSLSAHVAVMASPVVSTEPSPITTLLTAGAWLLEPMVMASEESHEETSVPSETRTSTVQTSPGRVASEGKVVASSSESTWVPPSIHFVSVAVTGSPSMSSLTTARRTSSEVSGARSLGVTESMVGAVLRTTTGLEETVVPTSSPSEGVTSTCQASPFDVAEAGSVRPLWAV